jgi:hypothetical protein
MAGNTPQAAQRIDWPAIFFRERVTMTPLPRFYGSPLSAVTSEGVKFCASIVRRRFRSCNAVGDA